MMTLIFALEPVFAAFASSVHKNHYLQAIN
jgi:hypothetical protein